MLLSSLFLLQLATLPSVLGRTSEFPVVNGVVGGVPDSNFALKKNAAVFPHPPHPPPPVPTGKLRIVENSGVCETTPGIYQASGYGDIAANQSMWFWFFAARKNPQTAPLALWFNGGPGSSSMIGLFQEHGPCRITNDSSTVVRNDFSWNNDVNMLYIDQPLGVGFSYTDEYKVGTSQEAAADVWKFLQIFFADRRFAKYSKNDLALWTESYGGHYGPTFAAHFLDQNAALSTGKIRGTKLNLKVLGIGNGLTDPLVQYPGYVAYAASNPYQPTVDTATIATANNSLTKPGGCLSLITKCYNNGTDSQCSEAQDYCNNEVLGALGGDRDYYDVRSNYTDPYPPDFSKYINSAGLKIGANVTWQQSSDQVYINFAETGDWMRNSRLDLEKVINAGVNTLIFDGDADYIVNYKGVEAMVDNIQSKFTKEYKKQSWKPYKVAGQVTGQYKRAGSFAYLRVYGAGHEVPAYTYGKLKYGQAALQFFNQITFGHQLTST